MMDHQTTLESVVTIGTWLIFGAIGWLCGYCDFRLERTKLDADLADAQGLLEAVERERDEALDRAQSTSRILDVYYRECCDREDEITELRRHLARAEAAQDPTMPAESTL